MSGGVDSSVAAALLVKAGYDVTGIMLRLWSEPSSELAIRNRCCTPDQVGRARRVAAQLGIPFYVLDVKEYFYDHVVSYFIDEYTSGRTPNPCIECNRMVRFNHLYKHAMALGAGYLATGHYARLVAAGGRLSVHQGHDKSKDQSYVFHVLSQEQLSHILLPIGDLSKTTVRALADEMEIPVNDQSESMDLCFLADGNYRRFLAERASADITPGDIVDQHGDVVGEHRGLPYYTVGQRKGLGISAAEPLFVKRKEQEGNRLIVAPRSEMVSTSIAVDQVTWVSQDDDWDERECSVMVRYRSQKLRARLKRLAESDWLVSFHDPVHGVTPGQFAVFYDGTECLGGGRIRNLAE